MIRVVAIDDHPIILRFLEEEIGKQHDLDLVGVRDHGKHLMELVRTTQPDVVILDLQMSVDLFDPVRAVQDLARESPDVKVIVLTGEHSEVMMHQLTEAGVRGYLLKSDNLSLEIPEAVRKVNTGKRHLSPAVADTLLDSIMQKDSTRRFTEQELNIIRLLCQGLQNDQIGAQLFVTPKRVGNALTKIYLKLDLPSQGNKRALAIDKSREIGLC